ncbi:SAM complex subunit SAM50 [Pneumocystis jirovecii RU7]|uniref:Bacterial surface antigen (D15) domain-containing protein n=1 Tax=Pneumocystis jirovecii (strain RU7) TaxID=1408657 RepID=A0A0W4ZJP4_PNEJ7|nr:SAM complex subunit SAM50 [Pneumocystis jirovecii RU7]KTW28596.1 hypothetical protein T551_02446 [Pneumocystis jirovecii RU7]
MEKEQVKNEEKQEDKNTDISFSLNIPSLENAFLEHKIAMKAKQKADYNRTIFRLNEIIERNSTLPVNISSIRVIGANNVRQSFLKKILFPTNDNESEKTLSSALLSIQNTASRLEKFDIFEKISVTIDQASSPLAAKDDIDVIFHVKEKSRLWMRTGTDLGNGEGSAYGSINIRNTFGGAENLQANITFGTHTRSAFETKLTTPINANPDSQFELSIFSISRDNHFYASHEELLKGCIGRFIWSSNLGLHDISYNGIWRQIGNLSLNASPTIKLSSGNSFKSSIAHTLTIDTRNNSLLPSSGFLFRTMQEIASSTILSSDTSFVKIETEFSKATLLSYIQQIILNNTIKMGILWGLDKKSIKVNDRFYLGGATNVRGFYYNGLGPHDGNDAIGGDIYMASNTSIITSIPKFKHWPLKLQTFVNTSSLLLLNEENFKDTVSELICKPSIAAGIGLIYCHTIARLELNFCLPIATRISDRARKGIQLGLGVQFM